MGITQQNFGQKQKEIVFIQDLIRYNSLICVSRSKSSFIQHLDILCFSHHNSLYQCVKYLFNLKMHNIKNKNYPWHEYFDYYSISVFFQDTPNSRTVLIEGASFPRNIFSLEDVPWSLFLFFRMRWKQLEFYFKEFSVQKVVI